MTSDNAVYEVNAVYSFLEAGTTQSIDVHRFVAGP
jgi:hypothetical protein